MRLIGAAFYTVQSRFYRDGSYFVKGENDLGMGCPSPASDYEEDKLDLNRYLIKNPAATFIGG